MFKHTLNNGNNIFVKYNMGKYEISYIEEKNIIYSSYQRFEHIIELIEWNIERLENAIRDPSNKISDPTSDSHYLSPEFKIKNFRMCFLDDGSIILLYYSEQWMISFYGIGVPSFNYKFEFHDFITALKAIKSIKL